MEQQVGFSTGAFHTSLTAREALAFLRGIGCNAVEIGLVKLESLQSGWLDEITPDDLEGFSYVSLHSPVFPYGARGTEEIFKKIQRVHAFRELDAVIFHPDTVENFDVFRTLSFPVAFENMDSRKHSFQSPKEMEELFRERAFSKFVLDVNHVYTNDVTMELASGFYEGAGERIVEFHVSGCGKASHEPLYRTRQDIIIRAICCSSVPIIIESVLSPTEAEMEMDYIKKRLEICWGMRYRTQDV